MPNRFLHALSRIPRSVIVPRFQRTLLACAIHLALAAGFLAASPVVQAQTAQRSYSIPAGPLSSALARFAADAGVLFSADARLTEGKISAGLSGRYSVQEGLARLLAESGLEAVVQADGGYTLRRLPAPQTVEAALPAVTVSGAAHKHSVAESNRLGVTLRETPQAATVIGADLIRAQGAYRLEEVLRNAPGVSQASGHTGIFSNFVLRGFQLNNNAGYFKDGLRFDRQSDLSLQNIEQVEVVRGPASLQYGKLVPGGFVNFVTRKPQAVSKHEATLYANQSGRIEGGVDSTGKLTDDGSVLYRINAEAKHLDSFRDHVDGESFLVSPAFTIKLGAATVLDVMTEHNRLDTIRDPAQPAPDGRTIGSVTSLDPELFYGEPDAKNNVRSNAGTIRLNHRLNEIWTLRSDYANSHYKRDMFFTFNLTPAGSTVARRSNTSVTKQHSETMRVEAFGEFATGEVRHRLLAGLDRLHRRFDETFGTPEAIPAVSLFSPSPAGNVLYNQTLSEIATVDVRNSGFYLQDQVEFGRWSVMLGARRDWLKENMRANVISDGVVAASGTDTAKTSPSAGLVYRLAPDLSLYVSTTRSLDANLARDGCGRDYTPSRGMQYEVGAKGAAFGDGLQWAVTAFDLRRTNTLVDDPSSAMDAATGVTCQVQAGEQRASGVELEASGQIARGWRLHGVFTHLNARVSEDTAVSMVGKKLKNSPEKSARLWIEYAFGESWQGLSASLGVTYVGRRFADDANTLAIPSYTVWEAGARYAISPHDTIQLAVKNLTDRRYVEDAEQNVSSISQGAPRTIFLRYIRTF